MAKPSNPGPPADSGPSWKPAKGDGNYGALVSAAAHLRNEQARTARGTTHPGDEDPDVPSPAAPDPTWGRSQHGSM